jgi:hypothetical protein
MGLAPQLLEQTFLEWTTTSSAREVLRRVHEAGNLVLGQGERLMAPLEYTHSRLGVKCGRALSAVTLDAPGGAC